MQSLQLLRTKMKSKPKQATAFELCLVVSFMFNCVLNKKEPDAIGFL